MADSSVEKKLLYLVGLSLFLHLAVFALLYYLPAEQTPQRQEPYMVDLREAPDTPSPPPKDKAKRLSDRRRRVKRETAPKETTAVNKPKSRTRKADVAQPRSLRRPMVESGRYDTAKPAQQQAVPRPPPGDIPDAEQQPAQDLFKPDRKTSQSARLFPSAGSLAHLEESYRKRFEPDVAEGNANFLNTDDIQFGSFLRRFENAVYGVWRYPDEAARIGAEGIVPVRITFNRKGEIEHVELLEPSRTPILEEEVNRTLRAIGPIGGFPRAYTKKQYHLIAFFQYNLSRRGMTGSLR